MTPRPLAAITPQNTNPVDKPAPYTKLVFLPRLIATVALDIFAGPGDTAITKNASPILNNDNI